MIIPAHLVNFAVVSAKRRAAPEDVAAALVAGLRRTRSIIAERDGYMAAGAVDDGVRGSLLAEKLRRHAAGSQDIRYVPLPGPSSARPRAIAVALIEDAVQFAAEAAAPALLDTAVHALLAHLVDQLGGLPDPEALLATLRAGADPRESLADPPEPSLFRVH